MLENNPTPGIVTSGHHTARVAEFNDVPTSLRLRREAGRRECGGGQVVRQAQRNRWRRPVVDSASDAWWEAMVLEYRVAKSGSWVAKTSGL